MRRLWRGEASDRRMHEPQPGSARARGAGDFGVGDGAPTYTLHLNFRLGSVIWLYLTFAGVELRKHCQ